MPVITLPPRTLTLSCTSTAVLFEEFYPWYRTAGYRGVRCVFVLGERTAGFQARLGLQTAAVDALTPGAPITVPNGQAMISTVGRTFFNIDLTQANQGDIGNVFFMRLGVQFSSTGATVERGVVTLIPSFYS